eukprot:7864473-Heterocapsa_arctica.AAC.1
MRVEQGINEITLNNVVGCIACCTNVTVILLYALSSAEQKKTYYPAERHMQEGSRHVINQENDMISASHRCRRQDEQDSYIDT